MQDKWGNTMRVDMLDGYKLFHDGMLALSAIEQTGMCIDVKYLQKQKKLITKKISKAKQNLKQYKEFKKWKNKYKKEMNIDSTDQLRDILYNEFGYTTDIRTETGQLSVDQAALESLDNQFVKDLLYIRKFTKVKSTYINNILRETVGGLLHPSFNLNTVATMRSSSSNPNFQNIPNRDPEVRKVIRRAFKPRPNHHFCEIDFSGVEVSIAACYNKDKKLIADIIDKDKDMHRDMAAECFILDGDDVSKESRQTAKNKFVFPQFYGDYYINCANNLWSDVSQFNICTKKGVPLKKHLKKKGIKTYEQFENHIKQVENYFWNTRYKTYKKWKDDHWNKYLKTGKVELLSGFVLYEKAARNEIINRPIQGSAFHCLLWSLIELNKWLKENKMRTKIIGQIHDSIVLDIHTEEVTIVLDKAREIMTKSIIRKWKWLIVPLQVEIELSPLNSSWYYKKEVEKSECICGCGYRYKHNIDGSDEVLWECPSCQEREYSDAA